MVEKEKIGRDNETMFDFFYFLFLLYSKWIVIESRGWRLEEKKSDIGRGRWKEPVPWFLFYSAMLSSTVHVRLRSSSTDEDEKEKMAVWLKAGRMDGGLYRGCKEFFWRSIDRSCFSNLRQFYPSMILWFFRTVDECAHEAIPLTPHLMSIFRRLALDYSGEYVRFHEKTKIQTISRL